METFKTLNKKNPNIAIPKLTGNLEKDYKDLAALLGNSYIITNPKAKFHLYKTIYIGSMFVIEVALTKGLGITSASGFGHHQKDNISQLDDYFLELSETSSITGSVTSKLPVEIKLFLVTMANLIFYIFIQWAAGKTNASSLISMLGGIVSDANNPNQSSGIMNTLGSFLNMFKNVGNVSKENNELKENNKESENINGDNVKDSTEVIVTPKIKRRRKPKKEENINNIDKNNIDEINNNDENNNNIIEDIDENNN